MPPTSIAELLGGGEALALPGVWDALGALLAARTGFRAVFLSGFCLSATRLARPDLGLLTQTEVLAAAARIALEQGYCRIDWTTDGRNDGAQRLYDRLGVPRQDKRFYRLSGDHLAKLAQG